ncbi:outer membrane beta-barrel protein [Cesiribacter andamanensis]|uniref:Porin n=1 Tax=Cesiribacter andamanensis AMV16 TaxID=1279009 RepID=M7N9E9_9BACT|nr:outer membrane beta-barrel protein [Cesiribacter andamanensis]EMR03887.1 hypothetical protein ADICEAN_00944 [Cesiribacter andamanensis AMV16]
MAHYQFKTTPLLLLLFLLLGHSSYSQRDSTRHQLTLSGYTDVYVAAFSDSLGPNALQAFTTVSPRDERFGLNVAQISADYQSERVRGRLTLHWGDIAQATWSEEFRAVQEAHLGLLLAKDLWLDGGFFHTHIGTESFLPKNNLLSSTAVATYNEPFFQSGARLSYEGSKRWDVALWIVSGYNLYLDVNDAKSVGLLLSYRLSERTDLTYTNLFGRESLDGVQPRQYRSYQNMYLTSGLGSRIRLIVGGDFGSQSHSKGTALSQTALMYNALATIRYQLRPSYSLTTRAEVFQDRAGFISGLLPSTNGRPEGLQLMGVTLGGEYIPQPGAYLRAEIRYLRTADHQPIFYTDGPTSQRWEAMITMGYTFEKLVRW